MADDSATFLKMQQQIAQLLTQNQTAMLKMNSILDDTLVNFDTMNKDVGKLNKGVEKASDTIRGKLAGAIKGIGRDLKDYVMAPFLTIFSAKTIIDAVTATVRHQAAIKDLSLRMGEAGRNTRAMSDAMFKVSMETGVSTDKVLELMTVLKESRVATKDLEALTMASVKYSRITGVAEENAARLTAELYRTGKMGKSATQDILAGMVQVQRTFGMSRAEMEQLNDSLIETTRALGQYGKSADQIKQFTLGVGKLSGAFSSVGVSADKAQKFIDDLLDPDKIQDNALLYAKLGVSMKDALSGNVDPGMLAGKFKDLGQQLKGMNNVAAGQLAKSMGMSLRDLRAMADMPTDKLNKTMGAAGQGANDLNTAFEQQKSAQDKFTIAMNGVSVTMEKFVTNTLYPTIEKIANIISPKLIMIIAAALVVASLLFRKKMMSIATDFGEAVGTATTGALGMASRKASTISGATGKSGTTGVGMVERTASNVGAIKDRITNLNVETTVMREQLNIDQKSLMARRDALTKRQSEIEDEKELAVSANRRAELDAEMALNKKEAARLGKAIATDGKELDRLTKSQSNQAERYVRFMGKEAQQALYKQLEGQINISEAAQATLDKQIENTELHKTAARLSKEKLQKEMDGMHITEKNSKKYLELNHLVKQLEQEESDVGNELNQQKNSLEEQVRASKKLLEQQFQLQKVNSSVSAGAGTPLNTSAIHRLSQAINTSFGKGAAAVHSGMMKAGNAIKTALSPKNILGTAKRAGGALAKGLAKLAFILGIVMTLLGPIIQKFKPVLDKIMAALGPIIDILADALMPIFEAFQPLIMVLVKILLPPILKILGFLLQVIGFLIKAIGMLAGVFNKTVGDALKTFGDSFIQAGQSMSTSADKVAGAIDKQTNIALLEQRKKQLAALEGVGDFKAASQVRQDIAALEKAIGPVETPKPVAAAGTGAGTVNGATGEAAVISGKNGTSMIQSGRVLTAVQIAAETNKATDTTARNTAPLAPLLTDILEALRRNNAATSGGSTGQATSSMRAGYQTSGPAVVGAK